MNHDRELRGMGAIIVGLVCLLLLAACSGGGKESGAPSEAGPEEKAGDRSRSTLAESPSGWKQVAYDDFVFSVPEDWKEERNTGVWFPGTKNFALGMPDISLQCGAMPIMPGQTVDGQIKELLHGGDPTSKKAVTRRGMAGHVREAQDDFGLRHIALTLEEKTGGGMTLVHFFNCRVPAEQYNQYEEVFRRILDSVR